MKPMKNSIRVMTARPAKYKVRRPKRGSRNQLMMVPTRPTANAAMLMSKALARGRPACRKKSVLYPIWHCVSQRKIREACQLTRVVPHRFCIAHKSIDISVLRLSTPLKQSV